MTDRTPFVVGILAIVAVVAWLVLRDDSARPSETAEPATAASGAAKVAAPEGPSLAPGSAANPPELPRSASPTADDTFTQEDRDDSWAPETEAEIAKRWKQIRAAKLASTECKRTQCKLVVTGSEDDVATAIADLEGPRGLHGFADHVLLSSPSKNPDGSIALRIYARFDR